MTRYVVDSAFIIDHLRGIPAAVERLSRIYEDGDELVVNEIIVCECWAGAHREGDPDLAGLLSPMEFVQPGPDSAVLAGRWRAEARARGRHLSLADSLIAAAADSVDATVLTRNVRDFTLTTVKVEAY